MIYTLYSVHIPINAYSREIQNGRRTAHDVKGDPRVT